MFVDDRNPPPLDSRGMGNRYMRCDAWCSGDDGLCMGSPGFESDPINIGAGDSLFVTAWISTEDNCSVPNGGAGLCISVDRPACRCECQAACCSVLCCHLTLHLTQRHCTQRPKMDWLSIGRGNHLRQEWAPKVEAVWSDVSRDRGDQPFIGDTNERRRIEYRQLLLVGSTPTGVATQCRAAERDRNQIYITADPSAK